MSIVNPSSAVIAKARAKYGRRLKEKDYKALVKCGSVGEIVRYLKSYTEYDRYLSKVSAGIHRGNLENILREEHFNSFLSLCRYNRADSPITGYLYRRTEIRELIKYLTLLSIGRPIEYIFTLPMYFDDHTEIPLQKLSSAHSYPALLELLPQRGYRDILKLHIPESDEEIDISAIEDALLIYSLDTLYTDISNIKNKGERARLKSLFDTLVDYNNYSRILRLKRFYKLGGEDVKKHILPYGTLYGRRLEPMITKETYEEVRSALSDTKVGKKAQSFDIDDEMAIKGRFLKCRHELYFSTEPEIVLLAYYIVSETEIKNLTTIIEGVRYGIAPERIFEMLII